MNAGWWKIDIHGCYSLVIINFAPICVCNNNRRMWRNNAHYRAFRYVINQQWWSHNAKSKRTVHGDNAEMSDRWLFLVDLCVGDIQITCNKKNNVCVSVNKDFYANDTPMIFTSDEVTRENHCRIASLVTKIGIHANTYISFISIILYILYFIITLL